MLKFTWIHVGSINLYARRHVVWSPVVHGRLYISRSTNNNHNRTI